MFSRVRWSWPIFTGLSIAAAVIVGIVEWPGLAVITLFAGACLAAMRSTLSAAMPYPGMGCARDLCGRSSLPSSVVDQQRSRRRCRGRITLGGTVHAV